MISSSEVVKLVTKDAYTALKERACSVFGSQARRAISRIEQDPASEGAKQALQLAIPTVPDDDEPELLPVLNAWAAAVEADDEARLEVQRAQVRLNLDLGGSAILGKIRNAQSFEADVRAGGDLDSTHWTRPSRTSREPLAARTVPGERAEGFHRGTVSD